jgi:hypothetical protein
MASAVEHRPRGDALVVGALVVALCVYYVVQISAGTLTHWPRYTTYFDSLANGFLEGHLYTSVVPDPFLLAQQNPYDPGLRAYWYWDASLYDGHYHLYWGPVPAVCAALIKLLCGKSFVVGDELLTLGFVTLRLFAGSALLWVLACARRLRPSRAALGAAVLLFGLASPTPFLLARGAVYEAAIAAGQFFLTAGWSCCAVALLYGGRRYGGREVRWYTAAGSCFALALGCRVSLLFVVAFSVLVLGVFECCSRAQPRLEWRMICRTLLAPCAPLLLGGVALALYNVLRFDDPFEFGVHFQTTAMPYSTSTRYWLTNIYSYLLRAPHIDCRFPWLHAPVAPHSALPLALRRVGYLVYEPLAGLLQTTPVSVFLLHPPLFWIRRRLGRGSASSAIFGAELGALLAMFLGTALALLPALGLWMATMRYLEDVIGGVILASMLCVWVALRHVAGAARGLQRLAAIAFQASALLTLLMGVLLGFEGYLNHYRAHNPSYARFAAALSCPTPAAALRR